mgnify:CR=1 FL=1
MHQDRFLAVSFQYEQQLWVGGKGGGVTSLLTLPEASLRSAETERASSQSINHPKL